MRGPAVPARQPSQRPLRHPYLRRRGEAVPSPRSRGAASAEGGRTREGLLDPRRPPRAPQRGSGSRALTWGAVGPHRQGAAPGRPKQTGLESKGSGLVTAGTALPALPLRLRTLPRERLTRGQPGAQQRPEEKPGLHVGWRAAVASRRTTTLSAGCLPGSSRPPGRGCQGTYPAPALRPRPFPKHPPWTPPLILPRGSQLRHVPADTCPCPCRALPSPAPHVCFCFPALLGLRKRLVSQFLSRSWKPRGVERCKAVPPLCEQTRGFACAPGDAARLKTASVWRATCLC